MNGRWILFLTFTLAVGVSGLAHGQAKRAASAAAAREKARLAEQELAARNAAEQEARKKKTADIAKQKKDQAEIARLLTEANAQIKKKDYDLALGYLRDVLKIDPNHFDAMVVLAGIHYARGNFDKSAEAYTLLLKNHPKNVTVLMARGQAYANAERYDLAIEDYSSALRVDAKTHAYRLYNLRAKAFANLGDEEKAKADRQRAKEALEAQATEKKPVDASSTSSKQKSN